MADQTKAPDGNVFKEIVRTVVREELNEVEKRRDEKFLQMEDRLKETLEEKIDASYRQYRDDVLTKLDQAIGRLKATQEEQAVHQGQHEEITDRLDKLESLHPHGQHPR